MSVTTGLSRQFIVSISAVVLCVIALALVGSYLFYSFLWAFWPSVDVDDWMPGGVEWAWMGLITCISLAVGVAAAIKLSRRVLMPLNSVAASLRRLADGDLDVQAVAPDASMGEAAVLVEDFNSMAKRLKRMAEEQSFWNAAIAHELRTPLTILRGRLQGLAEGVFEPDTAQFYSLLAQVEGLTRLIEDLRVVGLGDNGYLKVNIQEADLAQEIRADAQLFEPGFRAAGFVLQLDLLPQALTCDPARMRQALLALLENAKRHATPGTVTVRLSRHDGVNCLSVADEGPGVDEAFATHIFDPFQRGEVSRSRAQGGSGLGLAVVRAIALAHNGNATCRQLDKGGSCFELSWPAYPVTN